jgi:hypothetical protein
MEHKMLQIYGIEKVLTEYLLSNNFKCEMIKSKTTDSFYIKTNRGLRIRIANHLGHDNAKIIDLFFVRTIDEIGEILTNRKMLKLFRQRVQKERKNLESNLKS